MVNRFSEKLVKDVHTDGETSTDLLHRIENPSQGGFPTKQQLC